MSVLLLRSKIVAVSWFSEKLTSERRRILGLGPGVVREVVFVVNSPMRRNPAKAIQKAA
jgi:hypothetical protein